MQTSKPDLVATSRILWLRHDGSETTLSPSVGQPYQIDEHTWACPASLDGLDGRYPDIMGNCAIQALCLATQLIARRLAHLLDAGERLAYPTDRSPWDHAAHAATFGVHATAR